MLERDLQAAATIADHLRETTVHCAERGVFGRETLFKQVLLEGEVRAPQLPAPEKDTRTRPDEIACVKAGDRIRTGDVQLGKLAFYR